MALKSLIPVLISAQFLAVGVCQGERESSQRVVVLDRRTGAPAEDVTVRLDSDDGSWEAETGQDGTALFQMIQPGIYRLTVEGTGWIDPAGGARGRVVRVRVGTLVIAGLERSAAISGQVTDDKGEALAGVRVFARRAQAEEVGYTDDQGRYRIHALPAGAHLVGVVAEGRAAAYHPGGADGSRAEPIELQPGEDRDGVDLQLIARGTGTVKGRLVGLDVGTRAELALAAKGPGSAVVAVAGADGDGRFQFEALPAGDYRLLAWGPGTGMGYEEPPRGKASRFGWAEVEVREGEPAAVEVKMAPGVTVEASAAGAGCEGMDSLTIRPEGEWFTHWRFEAAKTAGRWRWEDLPPGAYRAEMPELEPACRLEGVRLGPDQTATRVVRLDRQSRIAVLVERGSAVIDGRVSGAEDEARRVVLLDLDGRGFAAEALCGSDGRFRFEGLAAGRYRAIAFSKERRGAGQEIAVERGQRVAIELKAGGD